MIFSVMCFQQQKVGAGSIPTRFGIYMHSHGVKRSVLELCNKLGVIVSYQRIRQCEKQSGALGTNRIQSIGRYDDILDIYIIRQLEANAGSHKTEDGQQQEPKLLVTGQHDQR